MRVLLAVIDDLYRFSLWSVLRIADRLAPHRHSLLHYLEAPRHQDIEEVQTEDDSEEVSSEPATFKRVDTLLSEHVRELQAEPHPEEKTEARTLGKTNVRYVGIQALSVYKNPTNEFDAVITTLPYGDMVMVLDERGRWASIVSGKYTGWVLREKLFDRAADVYPAFIIGEENLYDAENTVRVRAMLCDMFGGDALCMPLQAGEYVAYRLLRKGIHISWPEVRPRVPGAWHTILRGVPGISIGTDPKTGSIFEYMLTEEMGHVAYVESVFPDETISLSEINFPENGIYNERMLTRDEWSALNPAFIQAT